MVSSGTKWYPMLPNSSQWQSIVPKFYLMVPNGTKWFSMIQNGTQRHQMVTNGTWWYPMIISYRNESIYMSAEWSNAGLWRSNFRLDTSDRNFLNVNQGNKGGPLKISLLPFWCGWLSLKKVNLCIFEGWSNVGLERSSFRPDTLDKNFLRIHQGQKDVGLKFFPLFIAVDGC